MNEETFMTHVASRLGRTQTLRVPPVRDVKGVPDFWRSRSMTESDGLTMFREELDKIGGHSEVFENIPALHEGLRHVLDSLSPRVIATWGKEFLESFELSEVLSGYENISADEKWLTSRERFIDHVARADVGITGCDYAVADTGSVVLFGSSDHPRCVSLLPTVHVVLMRADQLRTRLGEALDAAAPRQLDPQQSLSSITVITGPSRSSDIENDLSIGVHGPAAVFVLILS